MKLLAILSSIALAQSPAADAHDEAINSFVNLIQSLDLNRAKPFLVALGQTMDEIMSGARANMEEEANGATVSKASVGMLWVLLEWVTDGWVGEGKDLVKDDASCYVQLATIYEAVMMAVDTAFSALEMQMEEQISPADNSTDFPTSASTEQEEEEGRDPEEVAQEVTQLISELADAVEKQSAQRKERRNRY